MRKSQLKQYFLAKRPVRKSSLLCASAVGLLLAGTAEGQESNPGVSIQTLETLDSWSLTETGDLRLVFENGVEQIISASDLTIVDGAYYISETLAAEVLAAVEAGNDDDDGIIPFIFGLGGLAVVTALAQNGGSSASTGSPTPPVTPPADTAPVFTSGLEASVPENQTMAITVAASDANGDAISYAITGGADRDLFSIDATSGVVTFIEAPDFEMPSDAGGDNTYDIIVSATAGGQTVEQTVTISVTNVDEGPAFTSPATASVTENQTDAITVFAADPEGDTVTYSITGGADMGLFSIDQDTGEVTFDQAPDYEDPDDAGTNNDYEIVVTATANGKAVQQAITISVTNVNDNLPVFTSPDTASVPENETAVMTVNAVDADKDEVTYSITGGADMGFFSIDEESGALAFIDAPDHEGARDENEDNDYEIVVTATAAGDEVTQAITISVTNVNDNLPVFTSEPTASAEENQTLAIIVNAVDADGDTVTYSITGGADSGLFSIDENTGEVKFETTPDFENPSDAGADNDYDIEVTATANGAEVKQDVTIRVTNFGEPPIIIDLGDFGPSSTPSLQQGIVIPGTHKFAALGSAVSSAGDVNGDGFDDLLVGPGYPSQGQGAAFVIFGGTELGEIDLDNLGDRGFLIGGPFGGAEVGTNLSAAGDINGDGFDDLILGSSYGEGYVIYGEATPGYIDLDTFPDQDNMLGFIIDGTIRFSAPTVQDPIAPARFVVSSAGDVNGDGLDDLIVSEPFADHGGDADAGRAYIVYGGVDLVNIELSLLTSDQGFAILGDAENDRAGWRVSSAGDFNGDGFDDVIVSAPYGDDGGSDAGEAYVIYGGSGISGPIDLDNLGDQGFIIQGGAQDHFAGRDVSSAGDVNGDGFDDVIVGANGYDYGGSSGVGAAYVIYGGTGITGPVDLNVLGDQGFTIRGAMANDWAGTSVSSAGDVNGDGFDDVIVGAFFADRGGNNAGEAYVIYGGTQLDDIDLAELKDTQGFIIQGASAGDLTGQSVSGAGDVNGDGFDDLIVGAPFGDPVGGIDLTDAGEAYVVYGGATLTESTIPVERTGTASADNFTGNAGDDSFDNIGADDVVRGGAGDDLITLTSLDFADIDGGHGTDTLALGGAGQDLNLSARTAASDPIERLERIEIIDLTGSGDNSLTLDKLAVLNLSEATLGGVTTLTVLGDAGDSVALSGDGWAANGTRSVDGVTYNVYENFDVTDTYGAELLVENGVTVTLPGAPVSAAASHAGSAGFQSETVSLNDPDTFDLSPPPDASSPLPSFGPSQFAMSAYFGPSSSGGADPNLPNSIDGAPDPLSLEDEMNLTVDLLHLNDAVAIVEMGS